MTKTRLTMAGLALIAALGLSACATDQGQGTGGSDPAPSAETSATFSDADVMFAQMMIPHHSQAIEMSETILAKDDISPEVSDLATQIAEAQGPEIDQLSTWLEEWDAEPMSDMEGMDHSMDGMMTDDQMAELEAASGAEAERFFLEMMTEHHSGAIEMAQTEVQDGENPDAIEMAESIIASQQAEIDVMEELLATR